MPAKFEVRDNIGSPHDPDDERVAIEKWPSPETHPHYSKVWAMTLDDARELYVTLGTYLEDE